MQAVQLTNTTEKIAEIVPPLTEQWYLLAPPSNPGWIFIILPNKSQFSYPLRPGAVMAISSYLGDIVAGLGYPGLPKVAEGSIILFSSEEREEISALYGV